METSRKCLLELLHGWGAGLWEVVRLKEFASPTPSDFRDLIKEF